MQVGLQTPGGSKTPDYILCPDQALRQRVQSLDAPAAEADLPALLEQNDAEAFRYFWLFFRQEAFIAGAAAPGTPAWLDTVLAESEAYEQGAARG